MDGSRFDAFSRTLARGRSRRSTLAALLGGILSLQHHARITAKKGKDKGKKKRRGASTLPVTAPPVTVPPGPRCPDSSAPHWCASHNTCVPACETGKVFDPATCRCTCALATTCCSCNGGSNPFCSAAYADSGACFNDCIARNPNHDSRSFQGGPSFGAALCDQFAFHGCGYACRNDNCGDHDGCQEEADCGILGAQCFRPDGGGPSRCGTIAPASCGEISHASCATRFGQGAFLVRFPLESPRCTCGDDKTTFCVMPASPS